MTRRVVAEKKLSLVMPHRFALVLMSAMFLNANVDARDVEHKEQVPEFLNPAMFHVSVEDADPNAYLSICPKLCELADGSLLIAYHRTTRVDFSGQYNTWTRLSRDGGKTWTRPRLVREQLQAPGLLALISGQVLLNGCVVKDNRWSTTMRLFRSHDNGQNWSEQNPIWENSKGIRLQGGCASLVRLKSGSILCPVFGTDIIAADYGSATERMKAWCYYSNDDGKTWLEARGKVSLPNRGAMEPSVAELNDGRLVMTLRTQLGFVYVAQSKDHGQTWCEPWSSGLEAPEAPLVMAAFPDGKALLLVYCSGKYIPAHHHGGERTPLSAAISKDAGKTWRAVGNIAGGPHEFGATAVCFASNGKTIIGYDWHRVPWDRNVKTGGVRLAIINNEWFDRALTKP
jgi:sialidase-1